MGVVYLAEDRNLADQAVVKRPHAHLLSDPASAGRFLREVRSLIQLRHPHICHVRDAGEHEGIPFLVMDFLAGGSLLEKRPRDANGRLLPMRLEAVLAWLPRVAQALDFIHGQGRVHRDIKPGNILFDAHGNPFVSDLGIAKAFLSSPDQDTSRDSTNAGALLGTPGYIAPEVALGEGCSPRADQYALGVLVYELLAAQRPFGGPTLVAVAIKQASRVPRGLHELNRAIPEAVSRAVLKSLARSPEGRYPTCLDLAKAMFEGRRAPLVQATRLTEQPPPRIAQPKPLRAVTNSIGMEMVLVPPGQFDMGTTETADELMRIFPNAPDAARRLFPQEQPVHRVTLSRPFYLGKTPVTVGQFDAFVRATGYRTEAETGGGAYSWTRGEWQLDPSLNWRNPGSAQGSNHPVVCVSWNDAVAFCKWLSDKERKGYRLPTEAEWEYACRAGTTTLWNFGNDKSCAGEYAWYKDNSGASMHPVGQRKSNAWGLHDMHGNVWEWCFDWSDDDYYELSPSHDPTGAAFGEGRIVRGGHYFMPLIGIRSAVRTGNAPGERDTSIGFRVAGTL